MCVQPALHSVGGHGPWLYSLGSCICGIISTDRGFDTTMDIDERCILDDSENDLTFLGAGLLIFIAISSNYT